MDVLKLFDEYPRARDVIKNWFLDKMLESFKDETVPDDFKEHIRKQGLEDQQVAKIIGSNPRSLFSVLDENNLFIEIKLNHAVSTKPTFSWGVNGSTSTKWYETRTDAELDAVIECFKQLNEKA